MPMVLPAYHNQADVLATLFHCWTATTHKIRGITPANLTLTLLKSPHVGIPRCEHASGKRFLIEDAREELDPRGEFYFDRQTRELTYLPLPAEELAGFEAYAPQITTLLSVDGASDLVLEDLTLAHAAADMAGFFDCDAQSATNLRSAAVELSCPAGQACERLVLRRLEIAHTGGFGLAAAAGIADRLPVGEPPRIKKNRNK